MDIQKLTDSQLSVLIENRWRESSSLWDIVRDSYAKNLRAWENNPEWLDNIPPKRSKARDNRTFLAMESVIKTLTGRPSKPNVLSTETSPDGKQIASDLQDFFLAKYRDLGIKAKMRRGLRWLFLSRIVVMKVFWNSEIDDFDTAPVDSRNVRFSKKSTSMYDTKFAIEQIPEKPVAELLIDFPNKKAEILRKTGFTEQMILVDNPTVAIREFWMDDYVCWEYNGLILDRQDHPYWDWDGIPLTVQESGKFDQLSGQARRLEGRRLKKASKGRLASDKKFKSYLYNHFDKPLPPYIFGTVLSVENQPVGQTSLIEQVAPLQEEIDKRKRQISDNADMVNGIFKIDTNLCQMTKAEAQHAKADPKGIWYGKGVKNGVTREVGVALPDTVHKDMVHSTIDLDNLFGTGNTFRGEQGPKETATGRAILREESYKYLDEFIDLVDTMHQHMYAWWFQMIKVRYTEKHFVKPIGAVKGQEVIELTQDDLSEGMEIQIIPGQIIPDDRMYRSERAKEEAVAGLIDPLTYFEETDRDNAMELTKRLVMFKLNPLSILDMNEEDLQKLQAAGQIFNPQGEGGAGGPAPGGPLDPRAQRIAELNQKAQRIAQSPEFQKMNPKDQQRAMMLIQTQMNKLQKSAATPEEQPKSNKPKK
uniref:Portal protein n=1 Tax=viral metagenome TaxID=1070528 RepID=A0A6M3IQ13_9ZZZZ